MTSDLAGQILRTLTQTPGRKAKDLATALGIDRAAVNAVLYGELLGQVQQDQSYRWFVVDRLRNVTSSPAGIRQDTTLAKLCRYYLECLSRDDQGVSVFASSKYGHPDYAQLTAVPLDANWTAREGDAVHTLIAKVKRDPSRLALMVGYPVKLTKRHSRKTNWEGCFVEPIMLFAFQESGGAHLPLGPLDLSTPQFNTKAIKSLTGAEGPAVLEEVAALAEELGYGVRANEPPELDEVVERLRRIRPEWDWKDPSNATTLTQQPALDALDQPGIYNRCVLLPVERSPFTKGLETELAALQALPQSAIQGTALDAWLRGTPSAATVSGVEVLDVVSLNREQQSAVATSLSSELTVITGPPGTGKSQVVTGLLANATWHGMTVVFTSKNNKAVDVVAERVNGLTTRPTLLRLGNEELQSQLSAYLSDLLAGAPSKTEPARYDLLLSEWRKHKEALVAIDRHVEEVVQLRNQVDSAEQGVEAIRQLIGEEQFHLWREFDVLAAERVVRRVSRAAAGLAKSTRGFVARMVWPLFRSQRTADLQRTLAQADDVAHSMGVPKSQILATVDLVDGLLERSSALITWLTQASHVRRYFDNLALLSKTPSLEQLASDSKGLVGQVESVGMSAWSAWASLWPSRLTPADRVVLKEYASLLKLITAGGQAGSRASAAVFKRYHELFPRVAHVLPCWAVTSLSVRGRIPFHPGFADLLVIDEASQCDIASLLPLLYRAKRVVVIGDPKQLRHISGITPREDTALLERHGLVDGLTTWAYSTNSVFDHAAGLCASESLIKLRDHHRSHSDIIEFSNEHFYEGELRIATDYRRLRRPTTSGPAVRWVDVAGTVDRPPSGGAVNEMEARAVVLELRRMVVEQKYSGSIGVVSPFRAQANRIRDMVNADDELTRVLAGRDCLVDTVHRFQGDERDVVVFSPVAAKGIADGAIAFLRNSPNLFNVAVTRARAALIVIGDRQTAMAGDVDYLQAFAEYASRPALAAIAGPTIAPSGPKYPSVARPETVSDWERWFYEVLWRAGIHPIPQYPVEKYVLDFALVHGSRRLNIEVDGEHYHRNWDGELCYRDRMRNERMIELGWDVMRFWVYQVRDETEWCIRRIQKWLESSV